ncbi:MAG: hypothetical protein JO061_10390 [Acidobacteriaceae bacterium]|nr:hypothetical protein [Acidobacteriaceae bacterium]
MLVSCEYVIDRSKRLATITVSGRVKGPAVAAAIEAVYQDPDWAARFALLGDLTGVTEALLEKSDFPAFVAVHRKYEAVAPRIEIILVRRELEKTMAQVYRAFMKVVSHKVCVCSSIEQAVQML